MGKRLETTKSIQLRVRISLADKRKLETICAKTGKTTSEVIRAGLQTQAEKHLEGNQSTADVAE